MTKTATQKVTQVCVLDQNGQPLMPTQRLGKVYRLLKTKKAHIVAYEPFTVQLDYEPKTHIIQPLTLGVDSGAIHSGYSIANEHREYYNAEVIARDNISKNISDKRMYRRNRRSRKTRYRKPRFNNRKNKGEGWIPPSLEQKVSVQVKEIEHLQKILSLKLQSLIFKKLKILIFQAKSISKGHYKDIISVIIFLKSTTTNVSIAIKKFLTLKLNT